jgi:uncharacterized SAM-binding protein YcdF (DUF218 family)
MKKLILHRKLFIGLILSLAFLLLFFKEWEKIQAETIGSWKSEVRADCAIVLTGGVGRVREGFDLLSRKTVKKLIVSGVYPNAGLREIMPLWPISGELHEDDIVLDRRSGTTYGNAQQTLPIVEALRCRDVVLVTSQLHMHRAYQTFKATFPEKISIYRYAIVSGRSESSPWEIATEVLKSLFYALWAY